MFESLASQLDDDLADKKRQIYSLLEYIRNGDTNLQGKSDRGFVIREVMEKYPMPIPVTKPRIAKKAPQDY